MSRGIKIGLIVAAAAIVLLPMFAIALAFLSWWSFSSPPLISREVRLPNQGSLIIDGEVRGRSEHGTSQRAGYRPPGSPETEWFGDVSDGVEPQVYFCGRLIVVTDAPSACIFVRNPNNPAKWKTFALVFPNDLGPFPVAWYAERNGLTTEEVQRLDQLGGSREQKWPTTYIESFDSKTGELKCVYHVDNKSSWPLQLQLSEDGSHLTLAEIGSASP
jgi:hypothetical protein